MTGRIIKTATDIAEGAAWLAVAEPRFAHALTQFETVPLRLRDGGFETLLSAIVSQQVSVAAADAIWNRLDAAGFTSSQNVVVAGEQDLRDCGLSRQKASYAQALASSGMDYAGLENLPTNDVITNLTAVKGVGRWTAEIYAMFSLGRADVLAAGDLALQEAARILFDLAARPTEKELRNLAENWTPWRAVAARILWAYYRTAKDREGLR